MTHLRIEKLPDDLIDQIAAGEVVERPASVVKELIDNALDADATRITLTTMGGGLIRLSVEDNGAGIPATQIESAFRRHYTSKIQSFADLQRLGSYGFRGEALASISSVSRITVRSREPEADAATRVSVEGGSVGSPSPVAGPIGTHFDVQDLFFNVPARRKFLKSEATESAHISEVLLRAALSAPHVHFVWHRDGRVFRDWTKTEGYFERVEQVFGQRAFDRYHHQTERLQLTAALSRPEAARPTSQALHFVVNGRPVRDRGLLRSVLHYFGNLLPEGRYPQGALWLEVPRESVDINVHPQKSEVRFADPKTLFSEVVHALELGRAPSSSARVSEPTKSTRSASPHVWGTSVAYGSPAPMPHRPMLNEALSVWWQQPLVSQEGSGGSGVNRRVTALCQLDRMFVVASAETGIVIYDQHALDERIKVNALRAAYRLGDVVSQYVLIPEPVSVSEADLAALDTHETELTRLGFEFTRVGEREVALRRVPALLAKIDQAILVSEVIEEIQVFGRALDERLQRILATIACHSAIRAGDVLSLHECQTLLDNAEREVDWSGHCPHGRPVAFEISLADLRKRVGR